VLRVFWVKVGSAQVSLAAAGFVLKVRGGQGSGVLWVVGYVYVIGVWCGKWVLINVRRKLRWGWSVGIFG